VPFSSKIISTIGVSLHTSIDMAEMGAGGAISKEGIPLKRAEGLVLVMETPKGDVLFA
jgi:hypothetical protein